MFDELEIFAGDCLQCAAFVGAGLSGYVKK